MTYVDYAGFHVALAFNGDIHTDGVTCYFAVCSLSDYDKRTKIRFREIIAERIIAGRDVYSFWIDPVPWTATDASLVSSGGPTEIF